MKDVPIYYIFAILTIYNVGRMIPLYLSEKEGNDDPYKLCKRDLFITLSLTLVFYLFS